MNESQDKWEHIKHILGQAQIVLRALMTASDNLDPTTHANVKAAKDRLDESLMNEDGLKQAVEQIEYQILVDQLTADDKRIPPHILQRVRQRLKLNS